MVIFLLEGEKITTAGVQTILEVFGVPLGFKKRFRHVIATSLQKDR